MMAVDRLESLLRDVTEARELMVERKEFGLALEHVTQARLHLWAALYRHAPVREAELRAELINN